MSGFLIQIRSIKSSFRKVISPLPLIWIHSPLCEHARLQAFEHVHYSPEQVAAVHVLGWHKEILSVGVCVCVSM